MLPETAYIKRMWALAHAKNNQEAKSLMITNIAGEISKRTPTDASLSGFNETGKEEC